MKKVEKNSYALSRILYRRGSSYERMGNYEKADKDMLESLKINPNEPYTMNYLAYSWLERNYKIDEAIEMIQSAYKQKEDDPYICLLYTSPSPRDKRQSRMPSSA